jgi:hypothetical protein
MNTQSTKTRAVAAHSGGGILINKLASARSLIIGLFVAVVLSLAGNAVGAGVQISGSLANFDVRYPASLPNDLDIFIYGDGLTTNDVLSTYPNSQWGAASSITASVNNDPNSPAFGLDCIRVRYVGPPLPALVGQMLHFGVRLKPGAAVAHQEVWWTINGTPVQRPCDPHITWICSRTSWLICITNPTPAPIYIYGCRWFAPGAAAALPPLAALNTNINPVAFGATGWTAVNPPVGQVFCIQPWCRIYIRVPVVTWRPIVFQIAARNVSAQQLPLPTGTTGPNPADIDPTGEFGTMAILTTRPTEEFAEDINGDGAVGVPDFNALRARFGTVSQDNTGN